jgi:outer membrane protein assembly factor BamB
MVASPVSGFNSPIVWGNRVFFSGGDAAKREVICLDAGTGQVVWRQALTDVPQSPKEMPEIPESTGLAAPSMATDGKRVYVIFANGDVGAFSLEGKRVWAKYFGPFHNPYGHANSLATWRDKLVLQ